MDSILIEVVIGLLLVYIALAFLLVKVQESVHGGWRRGRVVNMHRLLTEACGHDADVKQRLLANPLIFGLSSGSKPTQEDGARPSGPSSIPGDVFAKALLMTLNPSGQLPSSEKLAPLDFMDFLIKNEPAGTNKSKYLQGLRALVPASGSGWPVFEMAIATWFKDIGDRADGWYKRSSSRWGTGLAFALCALLNVDTANIVNGLGGDAELRQSLGRIADQVLRQRDGTAATPPTTAEVMADPAVRAIARLVDANAHISEAYAKDKAIARFGFSLTEVDDICPDARPVPPANAPDLGKFVSNSDSWVNILPTLLPRLDNALNQVNPNDDAADELRLTYRCLSHVSAWVRAASTASDRVDTRRVMVEAGKALEDSKSAILAVLHGARQQGGVRRLFRQDPDAFVRCASQPGASTAGLQGCIAREQDLMDRLPIGHGGARWRNQFCAVQDLTPDAAAALPARVQVAAIGASAVQVTIQAGPAGSSRAAQGGFTTFVCGPTESPAVQRLDLPRMTLHFQPLNLLVWLVGISISALFVSLGAPILFDTLRQWVNLRNAGPVRDAVASAVKGGGTLALPMLAADSTGGGLSSSVVTPGSTTVPLLEGAQAGIEGELSPRELQALKQRLDVQPSSGGFDAATREALKRVTGSSELTWASYYRLMGRAPVQAGQLAAPPQSDGARLRQPFALAPSLADNLNNKLGFPNRVPRTETAFSDELRAMSVLYRFKTDATPDRNAQVFQTVLSHPAQLDQLDVGLINTMTNTAAVARPRFAAAPWLDIALGELGQVESNGSSRATSNPRICDYLDAVNTTLGNGGDTTAWCAAFVTWVLAHPHATDPVGTAAVAPVGFPAAFPNWTANANGYLRPSGNAALALSWAQWPRPGAAAATIAGAGGNPRPLVGDVVVVNVGGGKHHVGFVFEIDTVAGRFWMLGGNQDKGSRVCLSSFDLTSIV